jgi:hypothetical protein
MFRLKKIKQLTLKKKEEEEKDENKGEPHEKRKLHLLSS